MPQTPAQDSTGLDRFGAVDVALQNYSRAHPSATAEPVWDIFSVELGQFAAVKDANSVMPDIRDAAFSGLNEHWSTVDLDETTLPHASANVARQSFTGTIGETGESYFYAWSIVQMEDIVGVIYGFSSWYHSALELSYLTEVVTSLAIAAFSEGEVDVSRLLPTADTLAGGLTVNGA